jgi:hypothetical protein
MSNNSAKARYEALRFKREVFLSRARRCAELTIPSVLPPAGISASAPMHEPYQGIGSRGVTNISSRLATALLPPGITSFRLSVAPKVLLKATELIVPKEVELNLAKSELLIQSEIERSGWRAPTNLTVQLLVVTGNALEQVLPDNRIRTYRLDQYVVARDPTGIVLEIVIEERISPLALPPEAQSLVPQKAKNNPMDLVELYTHVKRTPKGSYSVYQEVEGKKVPGSVGVYKKNCPFMAYRWNLVPGEDYGRGKVEEHIGDLRSLEGLEKAILDGAAVAARNLIFVKPNATGGNLKSKIAKANNGDVIVANPDDIAGFKFENVQALQLAAQHAATLRQQLAEAFLLNSSIQRDAERVTAYEVRKMAEELEGNLGGIYSMLSQDMQAPRLQRLIMQMQSKDELPDWPDDMISPIITTGLEALGRERDIERVRVAGELVTGLGPEAAEYADTPVLLAKGLTALGLPAAVRSEEKVRELRQQKAMMKAMESGAAGVMQTAGEQALGGQTQQPT